MPSSRSLPKLVQNLTQNARSDVALAVSIHDFVQREILFGFTPRFDAATPEQTLKWRMGHCNPQAQLMVTLLRSAGLRARLHFVTIDNHILDGIFEPIQLPNRLSHAYTEVFLEDRWVRTDAYIVDAPLRAGALLRLERASQDMGWGVHAQGTGYWDGHKDAFSQLVDHDDMVLDDHGTWESVEAFSRTEAYHHRMGPFRMTSLLKAFPVRLLKARFKRFNTTLNQLRADGREQRTVADYFMAS